MTTILSRASSVPAFIGFALISSLVLFLLPWSASAAVTASFDKETLSSEKTRPLLSGEATDLKAVRLVIENESGKSVLKKNVKVRKDEWKLRVSKKLKDGTYEVKLLESSKKNAKVLASEDLVIGNKKASSESTLPKSSGLVSVSSIPLLSGGAAAQGASVPVAYLKVQNTSTAAVTLEGFTLKQNGSASGANVIGFATSDDKGGSRATIGGLETTKQFKNGIAFVPLTASIAPGQFRIFTIKAIMSRNAGADLGKQLMLDVTGVKANGGVKAALPIRGVAWVLTQ